MSMSSAPEVTSDESGQDCSEPAGLAELQVVDLAIVGFDELIGLSDEALETFSDGDTIGTLDLAAFLAPGGGWGGSEAPARRAIPIGSRNGLTVTSLKRSTGSTGSDHHVGQRQSFAVDLSNGASPTPQMLRTARQIAAALGHSWPANGYLQTATTARGYRAQLIYDSSVVPNHSNHVHFGVRKVR
ncbi:MAG TPA: hypothetical protein VGB75_17095 [Jatrophihabitans sp.]|jgi:hypothetical protein|uniref:hypothetical protein n=1 Tax=Jatrophihabitans sp. TaxID=1932789 RepID=UPI002F07EEAC